MDFLIDYLPAIQFAAALNIGYIIPDIMLKMNSVLNNLNNGYMDILQEVQSKIILKSDEVSKICVVETVDNRTTQSYIDRLLAKLSHIKEKCDEKEKSLGALIDSFLSRKGYRSIFFYSALFSVLELLLIPFCHQHNEVWTFRLFLYTVNTLSLLYLFFLFLRVICSRKDVSCRNVFANFMLIIILSVAVVYVNSLLSPVFELSAEMEKMMSSFTVIVSFLPGVGCILFLVALVYYAVAVAKIYSLSAMYQFWKINKAEKKLHIIEELFDNPVCVE